MTGLRDIYAGEDVWVLASGASMGHVDPKFFEGKRVLGLNLTYRHFPCSMVYGQDLEQEHYVDLGSKLVVTEHHLGSHHNRRKEFYGEQPYYRLEHGENGPGPMDLSVIGADRVVTGLTSLVGAIHLAAYMGASNVILCGADYCFIDGVMQYTGYCPPATYYPSFIAQARPRVQAVIDKVREVFGCRIYSLNPFLGLLPERCKQLKTAPDHVLIPCKMASKRMPRKNLTYIGSRTLLDHAISRYKAWFPAAEIWVATECPDVRDYTLSRCCRHYPLSAADVEDRRLVSGLFNEFLQQRSKSDRCLCVHLDNPFVFRSELERAVVDTRPFVTSAVFSGLLLGGEGTSDWPEVSQKIPERALRTGSFIVADGGYRATPADYANNLSPVGWLGAIDINTPADLEQARKIGDLLPLDFFDDSAPV